MKCSKCNAEIDNDSMFCPECGNKIEKLQFCANCGAKLEEGATFCSNCGEKIESFPIASQEKRECPYCGEEILATAKKCKHCGEWLEDSDDEIENVLETNADADVAEDEETLLKKCSKCNAEIGDNARFCPECGNKIEKLLFCANCGAKLEEGATFCSNCGEKIESLPTVSQEKRECPYCGEEILATAKKCKHCGEWLEEDIQAEGENEDSDEAIKEDDKLSRRAQLFIGLLIVAVMFLVGFLLFKYGGWEIIWGKSKSETTVWLLKEVGQLNITLTDVKNFIFNANGVLIRVNDGFYGLMRSVEYFDSPIIQWIMLVLSIPFFGYGILTSFFVIFDKDDDDKKNDE